MAPKVVKKSVQYVARQQWFPVVGRRVIPRVDRVLYKVSGGRFGTMSGSGFTGLLLTTVGRKTGKDRSVPLLYVGHEGRYYLTGSNWGRQAHPAWSGNLIANPLATLTVNGERIRVVAGLRRLHRPQRPGTPGLRTDPAVGAAGASEEPAPSAGEPAGQALSSQRD